MLPVLSTLNTKHRSAAGCSPGLPNPVSNTMWVEQCTAVEKQNNLVNVVKFYNFALSI